MTLIYDASRQLLKVRFIQALSVVTFAFTAWAGVWIVREYGLRPADGGELAPLGVRLLLGGSILALGVAFVVGMWVYGRCYVARAEADEAGERVRVTLAGFFVSSALEVGAERIASTRYNHGRMRTSSHSVNAPWTTIRLTDRRLPLVLDQQGEFVDPEAVETALLGRPARLARKPARTGR